MRRSLPHETYPGRVTTVLLIRHGRSQANADGILAGRSDTPLDDTGEEQARALGRRLADAPLDALVTSPQLRARQTADLVSQGRAHARVDVQFSECDYGQWSGAKLADLAGEAQWEIVQWHPAAAHFPRGETMAEMAHRAVAGIRSLVDAHPDQFVWVVTHGDVIKAILADALGLHLDHFQRITVDTASVSIVRYTAKRPFVELVNDTGQVRLARKDTGNGHDAVVGGRSSQ